MTERLIRRRAHLFTPMAVVGVRIARESLTSGLPTNPGPRPEIPAGSRRQPRSFSMSDAATRTKDMSLPEIRRQFANSYTPGAVRFARYRVAGSIGPQP